MPAQQGLGQSTGEAIATFGLTLTILGTMRHRPQWVPVPCSLRRPRRLNSYQDVITACDGQADMLAEQYETASSERMLAEVLPVIPSGGSSKLALDVGAGTVRDAAWLNPAT